MIDIKDKLSANSAEQQIKEIAKVSKNVFIGPHAKERQDKRGIDDVDVFNVLRKGYVDEQPDKTDNNEWQCKIVYKLRGSRSVGVVVIFLDDGTLFIKTVEWEDL